MQNILKTRFIVIIAVLGALAGVLMFIKFPLPIAPSFYKLEFSDVVGLVGGFAVGPMAAVLICLIKNIINVIIEGSVTAFIGELANFLMSASFCVLASLIYQKEHTKRGAIKAMVLGTVFLCLIAAIVNYFLLIPAYAKAFKMPIEAIIELGTNIFPVIKNLFGFVLLCTLPFNLIKGTCVSLITYVVYKRISPLLKTKEN